MTTSRSSSLARVVPCALLAAVVAACAPSTERLEPKPPYAETPGGERALSVSLIPEDARWGEAQLWSRGAFTLKRDGTSLPIVHVGVRIVNTTADELSADLRDARIRVTDDNGDVVDGIAPLDAPILRVPPRGRSSAELNFPLPDTMSPGRVDSFELALPTRRGGDTLTTQVGFREREPKVVYARDPFWSFPRWRYYPYGPLGW